MVAAFHQGLREAGFVEGHIKGDPELAGTPVVLMSIVDQKNRGYALGAADYMVKPVDRTKLVQTLTSSGSTSGKALLVDDDDIVRRSVRQTLEPIGWQVTEAENGQIAVEAITAARPDVIILDLMMPKMDGFEFLDELRARPDWQDNPVVVITAKDLTDEDRNPPQRRRHGLGDLDRGEGWYGTIAIGGGRKGDGSRICPLD